jgi:SulP family sulfate permease
MTKAPQPAGASIQGKAPTLREHLRGYSWPALRQDAQAAVQVAMLDLPQGMGYAMVAGLPLQAGTMCSAVGAIIGAIFGSSRLTVFGPTNATAFLVFSSFATVSFEQRLAVMPLFILLVGFLLIGGACAGLADMSRFVSRPVIVAYVTGAAMLIILAQVPQLLGAAAIPAAVALDGWWPGPRTLPGIAWRAVRSLADVQVSSLALAGLTAVVFTAVRRYRRGWPATAIALVVASAAGAAARAAGVPIDTYADATFSAATLLPPWPSMRSPPALDEVLRLLGPAASVALLATLEGAAMSRTLAIPGDPRPDANRDMLALGVANVGCAFLAGMPCSASLTRSALNARSGATSPVAALLNGVLCLAGAISVGSLVAFIPRAALACLVVAVGFELIRPRDIRACVGATGSDALSFVGTLSATLFVPLHHAIFVGAGLALLLWLRKASRPGLHEYEFDGQGRLAAATRADQERREPVAIVNVEGELFFGAAALFGAELQRVCSDPAVRIVILRLKNARHMDATTALAISEVAQGLRRNGRDAIVSGVTPDVHRVLIQSGVLEAIGSDHVFPVEPGRPTAATRRALDFAHRLLRDRELAESIDEGSARIAPGTAAMR